MRAPLSWLKDFTPIDVDPADRAAVTELRNALDGLGLVVESLEWIGAGLGGVVLAQVLEVNAIEGADRIRQVFVDAGDGERLEIVCGAMNFHVGDIVPLATVGATLPNGMEIGRRKMRGVTSNGMLCSGRELELDDGVDGLLILGSGEPGTVPAGVTLGQPVASFLGIEPDVVFDLEIEPNRPDCLSIAGIARDLAAHLRLPFSLPEPPAAPASGSLAASAVTNDTTGCPRLVARVLSGVVPVASPARVANRLRLCGMRPINSVVDASNYVMLELGQPTHPYDLEQLAGAGIAVRSARPGEQLVTLDGTEHELGNDPAALELVITDAKDDVVGLAGVMGGASSEITDATTTVLLEVADFDGRRVGTSALRHGLRTEASVRFWRGTDPLGLTRAADRFVELVAEAQLAGGRPAPVLGDRLEDGPGREPPAPIRLRTERINALLGTGLTLDQIIGLLEPIGFRTELVGADLDVRRPSFRPDVTGEVDLIEEVARHHGYGAIAPTERRSPKVGRLTGRQRSGRELRRALQGMGPSEAWTSSLLEPGVLASLGATQRPLEVLNPVVAGERALRTHLLPGLLVALGFNEARRNPAIRLFEIGRVFHLADGGPVEAEQLCVLFAGEGDSAEEATRRWWALIDQLGIDADAIELEDFTGHSPEAPAIHEAAGLHPTRSALLIATGAGGAPGAPGAPGTGARRAIGAIGEVDPAVQSDLSLETRRVGVFVVDLDALFKLARRSPLSAPVSRYPSSDLDLAFVFPEAHQASELQAALSASVSDRLEHLELIDVYRGPGLPIGARSLTYRLRLVAFDHTLTDGELSELRARCIAAASSIGAELRS